MENDLLGSIEYTCLAPILAASNANRPISLLHITSIFLLIKNFELSRIADNRAILGTLSSSTSLQSSGEIGAILGFRFGIFKEE